MEKSHVADGDMNEVAGGNSQQFLQVYIGRCKGTMYTLHCGSFQAVTYTVVCETLTLTSHLPLWYTKYVFTRNMYMHLHRVSSLQYSRLQ